MWWAQETTLAPAVKTPLRSRGEDSWFQQRQNRLFSMTTGMSVPMGVGIIAGMVRTGYVASNPSRPFRLPRKYGLSFLTISWVVELKRKSTVGTPVEAVINSNPPSGLFTTTGISLLNLME